MIRVWLILNLLAAPALCLQAADSAPSAPSANTGLRIFQVKGVVQEVTPQERTVTIRHEDIPGYMQAMTMPFKVRDTNDLAGIGAGDPVAFRLSVTDDDGWIDQIRRTGPKTNTLVSVPGFSVTRDVEPLQPGDRVPEFHFTNQLGQA